MKALKYFATGMLILCGFVFAVHAAEDYIINGKVIYLRGQMNNYDATDEYALKQTDVGGCVNTRLVRTTKFKFADRDWSRGTNFGYTRIGTIKEGDNVGIELNPDSMYEDLTFYPPQVGVYKFCLIKNNDKYYVTINKTSEKAVNIV